MAGLSAQRHVYMGPLYYGYATERRFGENRCRNQIARATWLADELLLLECPAPVAETAFDILELAR
jgi:hypothetical protein